MTAGQNTFGQYGQYGLQTNPYAYGGSQYGTSTTYNQYGLQTNPYAVQANPYAYNQYGAYGNQYGAYGQYDAYGNQYGAYDPYGYGGYYEEEEDEPSLQIYGDVEYGGKVGGIEIYHIGGGSDDDDDDDYYGCLLYTSPSPRD